MRNPVTAPNLRVRRGQTIEAAHHNGLCDLADALQIQRGTLKGRQLPDGFIPRVKVTQTTRVDHPFKMSVADGKKSGEYVVTFEPGEVQGIAATINGAPLDAPDSSGNVPTLTVTADNFAPHGRANRALIYLRYTLHQGGDYLLSAEPVATAKVPDKAPWIWHKLLGWLILFDGAVTVKQMSFFSQGFQAVNPKPSGSFTPVPWAV